MLLPLLADSFVLFGPRGQPVHVNVSLMSGRTNKIVDIVPATIKQLTTDRQTNKKGTRTEIAISGSWQNAVKCPTRRVTEGGKRRWGAQLNLLNPNQ